MSKHRKVVKSGPTLDSKPSGISFTPSEETNKALEAIADQMKNPDVDHIGQSEPDESDKLDEAFAFMSNPPSVKIANVAFRKKLEASLPAIDVSSLFIRGEITQEVPILSGLRVEFRTLSSAEDLFINSV